MSPPPQGVSLPPLQPLDLYTKAAATATTRGRAAPKAPVSTTRAPAHPPLLTRAHLFTTSREEGHESLSAYPLVSQLPAAHPLVSPVELEGGREGDGLRFGELV